MKILVIGPSIEKSKGGMATVLQEIRDDAELNSHFDISFFESFVDGGKVHRLTQMSTAFLRFLTIYRQYDLFHIHVASYGSTFRKRLYLNVLKKAGKKVAVHVHGARFMVFYNGLSEQKKSQVRQFLQGADMVIALSQDWKNQFDEAFGLTNCVVLENGINTDQFLDSVTAPDQNPHAFAVMGRLGERKGTYDLLNAMERIVREVPDVKCYLAGDGDVEQVRSLVKEKQLEKNVEILGWINLEQKKELLKKVSIVVLPSYNEGLPMSVLEGMAAGKAIVSTTVGAIPEVVKEENGILVEAGDVEALASALIRCCQDEALRASMSTCNRKKIEDGFSMKSMHKKLAEYYEQVMTR